jgi:hypothetical protein
MSRVEHFTTHPDYGRANLVPMKHPRLAKLDSNPPEEWYLSFRVNGRTLAEHAQAENKAAGLHPLKRGGPAACESAGQFAERRNARQSIVMAQLTDTAQSTRQIFEALGMTYEAADRTLRQLHRAGRVECVEGAQVGRPGKIMMWRKA